MHARPNIVSACGRGVSALVCLALLLALGGAGCRDRQPTAAAPAPSVTREAVRGPLTLRLTADRQELTLADRVLLTLSAEYDEGYDVALPRFGANLEQFLIRDARDEDPRLVGPGRVQTARTYTLEPLVSGTYTVKPMKVTFGKRGEEAIDAHDLETPELTLTVTSLLPEDIARLDVEDIVGPRELPRPRRPWLGWGLGGLVAAAALAVWLWRRQRRTAAARAPTRPAHEVAYEELRDLVALDLVSQGRYKEFYRALSAILRRYIERRFRLHAPERTTEEFLDELSRDHTLAPRHKELLKAFLGHCDLVKFAEVVPGPTQIQESFDRSKAFIEETRADTAAAAGGGQHDPL